MTPARWPASTSARGTGARRWRPSGRRANSKRPAPRVRTELLRLAAWRASRSGLDGALVNPATGQPEQAAAVVHMLLDHCRDALADAGDTDAVAELIAAVLAQGNGASFQRDAYRRSGRLSDVICDAVVVTEAG